MKSSTWLKKRLIGRSGGSGDDVDQSRSALDVDRQDPEELNHGGTMINALARGEIADRGSKAVAIQADMAVPEDVDRLFDVIQERWGALDVMVLNAGATAFKDLVDITAPMYGYAGASSGVTTLTPLSAPTQNTNPAGTGTQAAAVASAGTGTQSTLAQPLTQLPSTLQSLASGGASQAMPNMLSNPLVTSRRSAPRVASQHDEEAKCRNHQRHPRRHPR